MFNEIGWQTYWTASVLTTGVYYIIILCIYYWSDLKAILLTKGHRYSFSSVLRNELPTGNGSIINDQDLYDVTSTNPNVQTGKQKDQSVIFQLLLDELQAFFAGVEEEAWSRNEFTYALRSLLKKYPVKLEEDDRHALEQIIVLLSKEKGSLHLSLEEIKGLWGSD